MPDPKIIYEDENFLAVDKPAGLMAHGIKVASRKLNVEKKANQPTLVDWLLSHYPQIATVGDDPAQRPGIVHRLDKDTSGVMLVAKNQRTFEYLKSLFQKHEIIKTYLAVVMGTPTPMAKNSSASQWQVIDAPIGIKNGTTKRSVRSTKMAKEAITEFRVLTSSAGSQGASSTALLEVKPKTGRTHQIRVHLASIGHPIVGDPIYGKKLSAKNRQTQTSDQSRLMLHALSIEFTAPDGKRMRLEAEAPKGFAMDSGKEKASEASFLKQ